MRQSAEFFATYAEIIPDFAAFCATLHSTAPCCIRVNTLRIEPPRVQELLAQYGYQAVCSPFATELLLVEGLTRPGTLLEALLGYYYPQALTSALAALLLAPQPGECVLDLCAAPGSKTSYMAQLMRDQGLIVANDRHEKRLAMLEFNLKHLGISNVVTTAYAGQNFPLRQKFARVLVDAPCSGEGNYRWDAQGRLLHYRRSQGNLPRLQTQLLLRGFDLLAPGGTLLYTTCTYNPAENEAVVQALLEQRPASLHTMALPQIPHTPGLQYWGNQVYDARMEACWRIYPHQLNSVGFFLACIRG
jgi:NOL1/NOP2/sun family putative RNA methylase